jgi:hypothetical protein
MRRWNGARLLPERQVSRHLAHEWLFTVQLAPSTRACEHIPILLIPWPPPVESKSVSVRVARADWLGTRDAHWQHRYAKPFRCKWEYELRFCRANRAVTDRAYAIANSSKGPVYLSLPRAKTLCESTSRAQACRIQYHGTPCAPDPSAINTAAHENAQRHRRQLSCHGRAVP